MATVKGVWTFNETLTKPASEIIEYVNYTYNHPDDKSSWAGFRIYGDYPELVMCYNTSGTNGRCPYGTPNGWSNGYPRNIDFGETEQTVSDNFYTWLIANAEPEQPEETQTVEQGYYRCSYGIENTTVECKFNIPFSSNGKDYIAMEFLYYGGHYLLRYYYSETEYDSAANEVEFLNQNYRTIYVKESAVLTIDEFACFDIFTAISAPVRKFTRLYIGDVAYSSGGKCFKRLTTEIVAQLKEEITTLSTTLPKSEYNITTAAVDTKIYLFGGGRNYPNTINVFDTTTNTITTLSTTLPTGIGTMASAVVGTKVYLFGGEKNNNSKNSIYVFDTTTNTITTLSTTLPIGAHYIASAVVGTKVYLLGGRTRDATRLDTINVFDTTTNTITTLSTKLPSGAMGIASAVIGTKIYLFGGHADATYLDTINVFDTTTNTITTLSTKLPSGAMGIASAVIGTKVYLFGGLYNSYDATDTINVFDTASNAIATIDTKLPKTLAYVFPAIVDTKVYLFGGKNNGSIFNTIIVFS